MGIYRLMATVLFAAACSWFILRFLIPQLRLGFLDNPNIRSSHRESTPSGGGIAFFIVSSAASGMVLQREQAFVVVGLSLILPLWRLLACLTIDTVRAYNCRLLSAVFILCFSSLVQRLGLIVSDGNYLLLHIFVLMVIAVTAVFNFTSFMVGLDGLVAGCMAVTTAPWRLLSPRPGRCGSWWVHCLVSCSGIGAPPRFSWAT